MENFGFGDLVNKIEEYFGRRVTATFLILAMATATVVFINILINLGIAPIIAFINNPEKNILQIATQFVFSTIMMLVVATPPLYFVVRWRMRAIERRASGLLQRAELSLLKMVRLMHESGVLTDEEYQEKRASILERANEPI